MVRGVRQVPQSAVACGGAQGAARAYLKVLGHAQHGPDVGWSLWRHQHLCAKQAGGQESTDETAPSPARLWGAGAAAERTAPLCFFRRINAPRALPSKAAGNRPAAAAAAEQRRPAPLGGRLESCRSPLLLRAPLLPCRCAARSDALAHAPAAAGWRQAAGGLAAAVPAAAPPLGTAAAVDMRALFGSLLLRQSTLHSATQGAREWEALRELWPRDSWVAKRAVQVNSDCFWRYGCVGNWVAHANSSTHVTKGSPCIGCCAAACCPTPRRAQTLVGCAVIRSREHILCKPCAESLRNCLGRAVQRAGKTSLDRRLQLLQQRAGAALAAGRGRT